MALSVTVGPERVRIRETVFGAAVFVASQNTETTGLQERPLHLSDALAAWIFIRTDAVVPKSDRTTGGASVIILGVGFLATPTVTFGGVAATNVVLVNSTRLTCTTPAHAAGAVSVVVTNPDATNATLTNGFTYYTPDARLSAVVASAGGSAAVLRKTLSVSQRPNRGQATFFMRGGGAVPFTPIRIGLGSLADADLLLVGSQQVATQSYDAKKQNPNWSGAAVDLITRFNSQRVWGTYTNVAADVVAAALLAQGAPGFTGAHVVSGLDPITVTFLGDLRHDAFNQIATLIGGYYYLDDSYDVHLFITESPALTPDALDSSNRTLQLEPPLQLTANVSQFRNRAIGIGASSPTTDDVAVGDTEIHVSSGLLFDDSGTVLLQSDRVTYTGLSTLPVYAFNNWITRFNAVASTTFTRCVWCETLGIFVLMHGGAANTTFRTSPDGVTWTTRSLGVTGGVAALIWVEALGLFVATGTNGVTQFMITSPDGITWTSRTCPNDVMLALAWSDSLHLLVSVGTKSASHSVMTSPDGITWTSRTGAADTSTWAAIAWSPSAGVFAAVASVTISGNMVMTSPDGVIWTNQAWGAVGRSITYSPTLGYFLILPTSNTTPGHSTDGVTWSGPAGAIPSQTYLAAHWLSSGYFIGLGTGNTVIISPDGLVWTTITTPLSAQIFYDIAEGHDRALVISNDAGLTVGSAITSDVTRFAGVLSGCSGITVESPSGSPVHLYTVRDDAGSQSAVAAIEGDGSTGIYDFKIEDGSIQSQVALDARCDADLAWNADEAGLLSITYTTRDRKSRCGRPLHVDLPWGDGSTLSGDFIIDSVTISEIDPDGHSTNPLYRCTASSQRLSVSLEDLLRHVLVKQ